MDLHDLQISKASFSILIIIQPPVFDCPGLTSKENRYDLDVPKVIIKTVFFCFFFFFLVNTPGGMLYLCCVLSRFYHLICFCSLRNCCWSVRPYQLLQKKINCCRKGELSVQTPALPDSLHLEKPYPFFMPWLWHLTNCANRINQEGANPCCLAWNKPTHKSKSHIIKCSGQISLLGLKGLGVRKGIAATV